MTHARRATIAARAISKLANAVVVSVDYRQAPENKFPAAHDDALATAMQARDQKLQAPTATPSRSIGR